MDVEAEIRALKQRVSELEGSFGFLTQQVRGVHTDLLEFRQVTELRLDRLEQGQQSLQSDVRTLQTDVRSLQGDVRSIQGDVRSLRRDLPDIIAAAVGEALRQQ